MKNTTLCYIQREGQYLMLHRVKKKNDVNQDKWVGIGGKFEDKESPEDCLTLAKASADVTHDHPDGIAGACAVAGAVYLARTGAGKEAIRAFVESYYPLDFTLDAIRESYAFDVSCRGSVPQAMVAFLESESFEDAIRNAISIGGDSDTIACMTGAVAEAFYGVPDPIRTQVLPFVTGEVRAIYDRFSVRYLGG